MLYYFTKRTIDITLGSLTLLLVTPLLVLVAVGIKLDSEGPVFVELSDRVGKNGKKFRMYKFRTMIKDAHRQIKTKPEYSKLATKWAKNSYKLNDDPRVTKFGKILRRFSIDEFPQLLNVIKGEMSLVGPRALYPEEMEMQKRMHSDLAPLLREVTKVKPGASGLWQVSGRSALSFPERVRIDAFYASHPSILTDIKVILKTPFAIIGGRGAH